MNSGLYSLNKGDFIRGLITAVFAGVAVAIGSVLNGVFTADGFDVFSVDWGMVGKNMVNAAVIGAQGGFAGYIAKNFLSDNKGALLGTTIGAK